MSGEEAVAITDANPPGPRTVTVTVTTPRPRARATQASKPT